PSDGSACDRRDPSISHVAPRPRAVSERPSIGLGGTHHQEKPGAACFQRGGRPQAERSGSDLPTFQSRRIGPAIGRRQANVGFAPSNCSSLGQITQGGKERSPNSPSLSNKPSA